MAVNEFRREGIYDERFLRPVAATMPTKVEPSGGGGSYGINVALDASQTMAAVDTVANSTTGIVAGSNTFGPVPTYGGSVIGGPSPGFSDFGLTQARCPGHEMGDEVELEDGRVAGHCVRCGESIVGRRMVGGLGLARLKTALVDALGDEAALPGLADELDRVEMMLELEEQGLEDARRLIETTKRMILALVASGVE